MSKINWKVIGMVAMALFVTLLPDLALAQSAPGMFNVPAGDLSKTEVIDFLFGPLSSGAAGGPNPLGGVISAFSGAVLMVGGLLVAYTLLAGVLATAHEGEVLGRKWSSVWIPLRISMGTALLLPIPSLGGFCLMQAVVVWLALQGVGIADFMWNTYTDDPLGGGNYTSIDASPQIAILAKNILANEVCFEGVNAQKKADADQGGWGFNIDNSGVKPLSFATPTQSNPIVEQDIGSFSCGSINFTMLPAAVAVSGDQVQIVGQTNRALLENADIRYQFSQFHAQQTISLAQSLIPVATQIADPKSNVTQAAVSNAVNSAVARYNTALQAKTQSIYAATQAKYQTGQDMKQDGWIMAGAFYMQVARLMNDVSSGAAAFPSTSAPPMQGDALSKVNWGNDNSYGINCNLWNKSDCNLYIATVLPLMQRANTLLGGVESLKNTPGVRPVMPEGLENPGDNFASKFIHKIVSSGGFSTMLSDDATKNLNQNPVIAAQNLGNSILVSAWSVAGAAAALSIGNVIPMAAELGVRMFFWLWIPGVSLAVALPMLPFMLWMGAVVGWMILLVEAVIAAPLWAVSHLAPDGDGIVGRAGQGYMLVLSLTLKPALMILGFIISMVLIRPLGHLVNVAFLQAFEISSLQDGSTFHFSAVVAGVFLYATLMISLVKKVFDLIHVVPDTVLRWLGAPGGRELGDSAHAAGGGERQVMAALGGMTGGAMAGTQLARGLGQAAKENRDKKQRGIDEKRSAADKMQGMATENRKTDEQQAHMAAVGGNPQALAAALKSNMNSNMKEAQAVGTGADSKGNKSYARSTAGLDSMSSAVGANEQQQAAIDKMDSGKGFAQKREMLSNQFDQALKGGDSKQIAAAKSNLDNFDNRAMDHVSDYTKNNPGAEASLGYMDRRVSEAAQNRDEMFSAQKSHHDGAVGKSLDSAKSSLTEATKADPSLRDRAQQAGGVAPLMAAAAAKPAAQRSVAESHLAEAQSSIQSAQSNDRASRAASEKTFDVTAVDPVEFSIDLPPEPSQP